MRFAWLLSDGSSFRGRKVDSYLRWIKESCLLGLSLESYDLRSQLLVVLSLLSKAEQTNPRRGNLVEDFLAEGRMLACLERPDVGHLPVGGTSNYVGVRLEHPDSEQPIVIGRLIRLRNTKPFVVGVEGFGHGLILSSN
ncbi:MAG: hypothetical protein ABSG53_20485 [Thermoguttaceae bacterium]